MRIFDSIIYTWQFLKSSAKFFGQNKDLLFFPIISLVATGSFLALTVFAGLLELKFLTKLANENFLILMALLAVVYFLLSFIIIYFNTSLIACATARLQGKSASVGDGLGLAAKHWWPILQWSLISTTVGLILNALENSHNTIKNIIVSIIGIAWSVGTYFVIPLLVFENLGPFTAIKRSFSLFGRNWRKVVAVNFIFSLFFIVLAGLLYGLSLLFPQDSKYLIEAGVVLFVLTLVVALTIGSAFNGIVNGALYLSIVEKKAPAGFDKELLSKAFRQK